MSILALLLKNYESLEIPLFYSLLDLDVLRLYHFSDNFFFAVGSPFSDF